MALFFNVFMRLGSAEEGKSCITFGRSCANADVDKVIKINSFISEEYKTFSPFFCTIYVQAIF
jgi:hypothetical protein